MGCHGSWWQEILAHGLLPVLALLAILRHKLK